MASNNDPQSAYRPVNAMLGSQPRVGPLPANQLFPWTIISLGLWLVASFISLPLIWTVLLVFWGDVTWWLLTGKTPWRFLSKFIGTPNLTRGGVSYQSIYTYMNGTGDASSNTKAKTKSKVKSKARSKAKPRSTTARHRQ
jgi:hypothetical protein